MSDGRVAPRCVDIATPGGGEALYGIGGVPGGDGGAPSGSAGRRWGWAARSPKMPPNYLYVYYFTFLEVGGKQRRVGGGGERGGVDGGGDEVGRGRNAAAAAGSISLSPPPRCGKPRSNRPRYASRGFLAHSAAACQIRAESMSEGMYRERVSP